MCLTSQTAGGSDACVHDAQTPVCVATCVLDAPVSTTGESTGALRSKGICVGEQLVRGKDSSAYIYRIVHPGTQRRRLCHLSPMSWSIHYVKVLTHRREHPLLLEVTRIFQSIFIVTVRECHTISRDLTPEMIENYRSEWRSHSGYHSELRIINNSINTREFSILDMSRWMKIHLNVNFSTNGEGESFEIPQDLIFISALLLYSLLNKLNNDPFIPAI